MTAEEKRRLCEQRCRTCLSRQGQHDIFETTNCIRTELLYLTNLEIRKYDKLPVSICDNCLKELRSACAFKKQCQLSYYTLIEEYENISSKNIDTITHVNTNSNIPAGLLTTHKKTYENLSRNNELEQNTSESEEHEDLSALLEPQIIVREQLSPIEDTSKDKLIHGIKIEPIESQNEQEEEIVITPDIYEGPKQNLNEESNITGKRKLAKDPHECKECGKGFTRLQNLRAHMHVHTGVKEHECPECGKAYTRGEHLKRHLKTHSADGKPHQCPLCDRSFSTKGYLSTHIAAHSRGKQHKCDQCDKTFSRPEHLKRHLLSHRAPLEYACTMCDKSFALEAHLMVHLQLHSGEKSYKCDICGLIFRSAPSLESHKMNHTVALPGFFCP